MSRPICATIDLQALQDNLDRARGAAPDRRVMAVIKANGYGHGLVTVARALAGADGFGLTCLEEALVLREAGIRQPLVLLEGFFEAAELDPVARHHVEVVVHHASQIDILERARLPAPIGVWLKVDTGMHRLGFAPSSVGPALERLRACSAVGSVRFLSHLAFADDRRDRRTESQCELFQHTLRGLPGERSLANSAGVLGWGASHLDWVRPGIMLYGVSPFVGSTGEQEGLRPVMTLGTRLVAVNRCRRGDAVGYGGTWVCPEDMAVGVATIGYGDGYPRHARSGTPVLVGGRRAALVGRVSMDMIAVDLRGHPDARVGDPVVLWGAGLPVEEVAESAGTIAYELLCGVAERVPRHVPAGEAVSAAV